MMTAEEGRRKREKPCVTKQQAAKAVAHLWNIKIIQSKMKTLVSYDDQNFYCCSSDGAEYTLKIHNGVDSDNWRVVKMQNEVLSHVSKTLPCPKPIPCFTGQFLAYAEFNLKNSTEQKCFVLRLLTWVPGNVLTEVDHGRATTVKTGETLYQLQQCMLGCTHPSMRFAHRVQTWDMQNLLALTPLIKYVKPELVPFVERAMELFKTKILPVSKHFTAGVCQNDFNDGNILVSKDGKTIKGILDFGDLVHTWVVADLAIAMAYAMLSKYGKTAPLDALEAFLEGWRHAGGKLNQHEEAAVYILTACRLAASITIGAYSYSKQPENTYLLLHAKPAWDSIKLLMTKLES